MTQRSYKRRIIDHLKEYHDEADLTGLLGMSYREVWHRHSEVHHTMRTSHGTLIPFRVYSDRARKVVA